MLKTISITIAIMLFANTFALDKPVSCDFPGTLLAKIVPVSIIDQNGVSHSNGSAYRVTPRIAITSSHVITLDDPSKEIMVEYKAHKVLIDNPNADYAILVAEETNTTSEVVDEALQLMLEMLAKPNTGDLIIAVGYLDGRMHHVGAYAQDRSIIKGARFEEQVNKTEIIIDKPVIPGMSGGPAFTCSNDRVPKFVGINKAWGRLKNGTRLGFITPLTDGGK